MSSCNTCYEYNSLNGIQIAHVPESTATTLVTTTKPDPRTFQPQNLSFPPIQPGPDLNEGDRVEYGGTNCLLIGLAVAGLGVAGYVGYRYFKAKKLKQ